MEPNPPQRASKKLDELYEVSLRILDSFPLSPDEELKSEQIAIYEKELRADFDTLCVHLISMAAAEIRVRGLHEKIHDPENDDVTINDAACIAVSFLFYPRKQSGLREIVEIVRSLFRRNPNAGPIDLFNYLSAVISRNLSQSEKQKARFDNPWYYCVARCVDFHVRSRPRYSIEGKRILDLMSRDPGVPFQMASSEDMISLCNRYLPLPKRPGAAIDLIFDCLRESDLFDGRVDKLDLYLAVYKLMTPHMTSTLPATRISTPEEVHLVSSMHMEAYDLLGEMEESYNWRKVKDGNLRSSYLYAGEDILMDFIYFGERKNSLREYLAAHIAGFTKENWLEHKGSFQHFSKVLENRWSKKLREL